MTGATIKAMFLGGARDRQEQVINTAGAVDWLTYTVDGYRVQRVVDPVGLASQRRLMLVPEAMSSEAADELIKSRFPVKIKVVEYQLTSQMLMSLPPSERKVVLLMAHALNEISYFNKLLVLALRYDKSTQVLRHVGKGSAMMLTRVLIGKLFEAWKLLDKGVLRSPKGIDAIAATYGPALGLIDPSLLLSFKSLKSYFGKSNAIDAVRNNYGFHYSLKHVDDAGLTEENNGELQMYLARTMGSSFNQFAEHAVTVSMLRQIGGDDPDDLQAAADRLFDEMMEVADWLTEVLGGFIMAIFMARVGANELHEVGTEIEVENVASLSRIALPFFIHI